YRDEESPDRAVRIVGAEVASRRVELCDHAGAVDGLQDRPARWCVAQILCQAQVFGLRDAPELGSVLLVMLIESRPGDESWTGGPKQQRRKHRQKNQLTS